jgi:hypothetical protein
MIDLITAQVGRLLRRADDRYDEIRKNPVTGAAWISEVDPEAPQKRTARNALLAQVQFRKDGAAGIELPLSYEERERLKRKGRLEYLVSCFARSVEHQDFNLGGHPSFKDYARGVLASPYAPPSIKADVDLLKRYPPEPLTGLGTGLIWRSGR